MNFSQGHSGPKVQCESCPEFTKMSEIHELFVLALSLVWFAGATPNFCLCVSFAPQNHIFGEDEVVMLGSGE